MKKKFFIDGKEIGENRPTYIIAEMSANHLQNFDRAKHIIKAAKDAGADAVKLQTYTPDTITINCRGEEFMATKGSLWEGKNLYELYEKAYMPWSWHKDLFSYANDIGITIFSTPFDSSAVDLLEELETPAYKIASYEIFDIPLIRKIAKTNKPIIFSTGIAELADIELAVKTCQNEGNLNIAVLKCVSEYPAPYKDINLRTIPNISETFNCVAGLSDHSMGSAVAIAAVSIGARIIEKHFTLARADGGPDGFFSMEPLEFKKMVNDIRNIEDALGSCTYELTEKQKRCKKNSRSLYVVKDMEIGEIISEDNVRSVRPGLGIKPKYWDEIVGKKITKSITKGTALKWDYIER